MFFKRVLTAAEASRLNSARRAVEARRFKRPINAKTAPKSLEAKTIEQTRFHNSQIRSRSVRICPRSPADSFGSRIELEPYERKFQASLRRSALEKRTEREGRFALLNPPHGFEPALPDPQTFGCPTDLLSVGERALELKVVGGEFWRQFWKQAAQMVDLIRAPELIDFLEIKEDSQYRHNDFLRKAARHLIGEVDTLALNEIGKVFSIYRHFDCYSFELMETLSRRAVELLEAQILIHRQIAEEKKQDTSTTALTLHSEDFSKHKKMEKAFDPKPLSQILKAAIDLRYINEMLAENKLISIAVEVLVSCRLVHNFSAVAESFALMAQLKAHLTPIETQRLTMKVQLITAVLPERPQQFVSRISPNDPKAESRREFWRRFPNVQASLSGDFATRTAAKLDISITVDTKPAEIGLLLGMISKYSRQHDIVIQPDVRDILAFNLASSVRLMLAKFSDLSTLSPYLAQAPFSYPSSVVKWQNGKAEMIPLNLNLSDVEDFRKIKTTTVRQREQLGLLKQGLRRHLKIGSVMQQRWIKKQLENREPGEKGERRHAYAYALQREIRKANLRVAEDHFAYRRLISKFQFQKVLRRTLKAKLEQAKSESISDGTVVWENNAFVKMKADGTRMPMEDKTKPESTTRNIPLSMYDKSQKLYNRFSRKYVIWPSDQTVKRRKLFEDVIEPAVQGIITLWREMAPIAHSSGTLQLTPSSSSSSSSSTPSSNRLRTRPDQRLIGCDWKDRNKIVNGFFFIPNYRPTAHEWAVIGAAVTAILRLGPFALSPEGLCLILEAITLRAICEAVDTGKLEYPDLDVTLPPNVSRTDSFFTSARVGRGLNLTIDEFRTVEMCCSEALRKWTALSDEQKYRICLSVRSLGFQNRYLHSMMVDDWMNILKGGRILEILTRNKGKKATKHQIISPTLSGSNQLTQQLAG